MRNTFGAFLLVALLLALGLFPSHALAEDLQPQLTRLLKEARDLSPEKKRVFTHVIEHGYLPQCPGKDFGFVRLEDAMTLSYMEDGTKIVSLRASCVPPKPTDTSPWNGEDLYFDSNLKFLRRDRAYFPLKVDPNEEEEGPSYFDELMKVYNNHPPANAGLAKAMKAAILKFPKECDRGGVYLKSEDGLDEIFQTYSLNKNILLIQQQYCDGFQAFLFDPQGNLLNELILPGNHYGFMGRAKIVQLFGDSQEDLWWENDMMQSTIPAVYAEVFVYRLIPKKKPLEIFNFLVYEQECWEDDEKQFSDDLTPAEKNTPSTGHWAEAKFEISPGKMTVRETRGAYICANPNGEIDGGFAVDEPNRWIRPEHLTGEETFTFVFNWNAKQKKFMEEKNREWRRADPKAEQK